MGNSIGNSLDRILLRRNSSLIHRVLLVEFPILLDHYHALGSDSACHYDGEQGDYPLRCVVSAMYQDIGGENADDDKQANRNGMAYALFLCSAVFL
jgi:hypothetical protein